METQSRPRDARTHIVRSALDLIGEHGVGGLTNRRIAQTAGISLGTLTYYFASQDELLSEALTLFVDDEVARLAGVTKDLESASLSREIAAELVQELIEGAVTRHQQIAQFELYLHAARNTATSETARRCYAAYDELAVATLRVLGAPEPERSAPILIALIEGFELRRLAAGKITPALSLADVVKVVLAPLISPTTT